jgi:hypothetical protein
MPSNHVDVVKNEWLDGHQNVVARLSLAGRSIHLESPDQATWEPIVLKPFRLAGGTESIDPERSPREFLERLSSALTDSYLFATRLHSHSECPYPDWRAQIEPARVPHSQEPRAANRRPAR